MFKNALCKYVYNFYCKKEAEWRLLFKSKIKNKNPDVQFNNTNY